MSQFNIDEIEKRTLSGLKDFQRATVERVDYLFRHNQNHCHIMRCREHIKTAKAFQKYLYFLHGRWFHE